jgi:3-phosphoshikimate 1-carboxyvinyltransferase
LVLGTWSFNAVPLPDLIEIVPLMKPVQADLSVPGSKSITNRALMLAALADGETRLRGALWSEDTQVMAHSLGKLGFAVHVERDPDEVCNRTISVHGLRGRIPNGGTLVKPLELFVGNAGTAARFLSAMVCLGPGIYRLLGVKRMHERPQEALFDALRELGYCIDSVNDKLPATIHGSGPKPGASCCVSISESSQFASALLLCAKAGGWRVNVVGENAEESPYVAMTAQLIEKFPKRGGEFQIEPDASSGTYFMGADWLLRGSQAGADSFVSVRDWPQSGWQIDQHFRKYLPPPHRVSRKNQLGDGIMTVIVLATCNEQQAPAPGDPDKPIPVVLPPGTIASELTPLRLQETERVKALRAELGKLVVAPEEHILEDGDSLHILPCRFHGRATQIETYNDHRMAMCFAILGLKVPGIKIKNPACVKKTFPNFFQKLAAPPPHGLGATILDAPSGRRLGAEELFAD